MTPTATLTQRFGLDRAVFLTLANRGWSVASGLVTVLLIGRFLTPQSQGYFYTFSSLITLQVLVELGLTYAIVQFASHEMAQLQWREDGTVQGPPAAKQRLRSLLDFSLAWFGAAAVVMAAVLVPLGIVVAGREPSTGGSGFSAPWTAFVILSALNLVATAAVALVEGCGRIAQVALLRLVQSIVATTALWWLLATGDALHALVAQAAAMLAVAAIWLALAYRHFLVDLFAFRSAHPGIGWRNEIWPFHWRIAVSWASGYLIFQLFTPLLFASHGAVDAGRMGLSLQVMAALNGLAMAWIGTKVPLYGKMVARKEGRQLDRLFFTGLAQSSVVLAVCLGALLAAAWALQQRGSVYADRIVPWPLLAALALVAAANHLIFAQAAVLRAHKQEPFMAISLASGIATAVLAVLLIPPHGLAGAVAAYGLPTLFIGLGGGTVVFLRKRRTWWLGHEQS